MNSLRKALQMKADSVEAQRGIVALEMDAGRPAEAVKVAREVQKQRPTEWIGYALEGDIYVAQKKWADATAAYRAGLARTESAELATRLFKMLGVNGTPEAAQFAAAWLKNHPQDYAFRLYLAEAATARKDYASAAQHYRKLVDTQPNNAVMLNNLAFAEGQVKNPKAVEYAETANKLAPNEPAILDTLGQLLVDNGNIARGLDLLQKASSMAPDVASIRINFVKALIKAGQKDAARKELDQLAKLGDKFPGQGEVAQLKQGL
jgi:putative PEP-CTERM system TPR-repeat lipoprotein